MLANEHSLLLLNVYKFSEALHFFKGGNQRLQKITWTNVSLKVAFKVIYALGILAVVYLYRGTPLFFLPAAWLWPFHKFVAFPSGIPGGVGVGFWMLCCNTLVSRILSFLPANAKDAGQSAFKFPISIPIPEPSDIPLD